MRYAGFCGVNPYKYSLHDLHHMYHGKNETEWEHTSWLLAMVASALGGSKDKKLTPDNFNPYALERKERAKEKQKVDISILKTVFVDNWRKK